MNLQEYIQEQAQAFANAVFQRDPNAKVQLTQPAIQGITNNFEQPIADLIVETGGKTYNYSLTLDPMSNTISTTPIVQAGE